MTNRHTPGGPATASEPAHHGRWAVMSVLAMTPPLAILPNTALTVAITDIVHELNVTIPVMQAAMSLYGLVMAVCMLPGTRFSARFGARRAFYTGVILYGIGAVVVGAAVNGPMLFVGYALTMGMGASLMTPTMLSLLSFAYHGPQRVRALAINSAIASVTMAIGPLVGGALATYLSWRLVFVLVVVVAAVVVVRARTLRRIDLPAPDHSARLDVPGVTLFMVCLACLIGGSLLAREYGWLTARKPFTIGGITLGGISVAAILLGLGLVCGVGLVAWLIHAKRARRTALIDVALFRSRGFDSALAVRCITGFALFGLLFLLPVYLQTSAGYSAMQTGLSLLPFSLTLFAISVLVARLAAKVSAKPVIVLGACLVVAGGIYLAVLFAGGDALSGTQMIPAIALLGGGMGCMMSLISNLALSSQPPDLAGQASGVLTTGNSLASALGTAITGSLLLAGLRGPLTTELNRVAPGTAGMSTQQLSARIADLVDQMRTGAMSLPPLSADQTEAARQAMVSALDTSMFVVMLVMAGVAAVAAVVALLAIPRAAQRSSRQGTVSD